MEYEAYHLKVFRIGEVTILKHAISHIVWIYDNETSRLPDKCMIYLLSGQALEIMREHTKILYKQIRGVE